MGMTLPVSARIGGRYIHYKGERELFDIELNIGWEAWSMVESFVMDGNGLDRPARRQDHRRRPDRAGEELERHRQRALGSDINVVDRASHAARGRVLREPRGRPRATPSSTSSPATSSGAALDSPCRFKRFDWSLAYAYMRQLDMNVKESESKVSAGPGQPVQGPTTTPMIAMNTISDARQPRQCRTLRAQYHALSTSASVAF